MTTKYMELANKIKNLIETAITQNPHKPFRLPTEAMLCQTYSVSRQTVRKALSILEEEHWIQKRQGSGSYAVKPFNQNIANQIAILVQSNSEYIYPRLISDICSTLHNYGYAWTVYITDCQISKEREILKFLLDNPVCGILSEGCKTSLPTPNYDLYNYLTQKGTSIVFFSGNYINLSEFITVKDDNYEGGYILGKYLASLGHQKIGSIFRFDEIQGIEQCFGLMSALRDMHLLYCENYICSFDTQQLTALRKNHDTSFLSDFINEQLKNVTAIVCCNDEIAYWLVKELNRRNIRIPDDISIVCFECSYLSDLSSMKITSLSRERELGTTTAATLIDQIKGLSVLPQKLSCSLEIKHSSSSPK